MATTWGKVLDQASIIGSGFREIEKACIKATRHDDTIPKEKHVRRLILSTHEKSEVCAEIYAHLVKRLELPDWIVVLKTLVVFHRLFRDGNPRFVGDLKWKGTIFPLSRFTDITSPEAQVQSVFVRKYALYLEEKVMVFRALRMEFEKDPGLLKGLSVEDSFVRLPKLQRQLDALINCQTSAEAITNPITALAFEMLLKDSFKLYRGLNDAIITLLETYFSLDKSMAFTALDLYKAFMRETSSIIAMYEMAKKKFTLELPDLKHAPTTLVNSMEDYVKDMDEGRRPDEHGNNKRDSRAGGAGRAPRAPSPQQEAPNLFDMDDHAPPPQQQRQAQNVDPFGISAPPPQQARSQQPQSAAFDPFGDAFAAPAPATSSAQFPRQNSQPFRQTSSQTFAPPAATSSFAADPFGNNPFQAAPAPQQHPQVSYEEKALNIKAAFAPALTPTSPTLSSTASGAPNSPYNYPKPNYNVSLNPQQPQYPPQGGYPQGAQYGQPYASNPFNTTNSVVPYGIPQAQPQQPANPFF